MDEEKKIPNEPETVTYTKVTHSDGRKEHKNKKLHTGIYKTVETLTYELNYHVKVYRNIYHCSVCGQEESYEREEEMNFRKGNLIKKGKEDLLVEGKTEDYNGRIWD